MVYINPVVAIIILSVFALFSVAGYGDPPRPNPVKYMRHGMSYYVDIPAETKLSGSKFRVFCFKGEEPSLTKVFYSEHIKLNSPHNDYIIYKGNSPHKVYDNYEQRHRYISDSLLPPSWDRKKFEMHPFEMSCIGIDTNQEYEVEIIAKTDLALVAQFAVGMAVFLKARRICEFKQLYQLISATGIVGVMVPLIKMTFYTDSLKEVLSVWQSMFQLYFEWYATFFIMSMFSFFHNWRIARSAIKFFVKWILKLVACGVVYYASNDTLSVTIVGFAALIIIKLIQRLYKYVRSELQELFSDYESEIDSDDDEFSELLDWGRSKLGGKAKAKKTVPSVAYNRRRATMDTPTEGAKIKPRTQNIGRDDRDSFTGSTSEDD